MRRFYLFLFLLLVSARLMAQKNIVSQPAPLLWTRYHFTLELSPKFLFTTEADNRIFSTNLHQYQFINHNRIVYRFDDKLDAAVGFSYSEIRFKEPDSQTGFVSPELRPFQEFYVRQALNKNWRIQHRFRNEQRFFRNNDGQQLLEGYKYNGRFRYQLAVNFKFSPKWELRANDELFINYGKNIILNTFDHNRMYLGVAFRFLPTFAAELGYLKSIQQRSNGYDFLERNHIRFSLYQVISRKKNKKK